jgi:hypothetical protein
LWGEIIRKEKRYNLMIRRRKKMWGGKNNTLKENRA